MEEYLKYKVYGSVFLISMATGLIVIYVYICDPCYKKIEENSDFLENSYQILPPENILGGLTSTASISAINYPVDNITIKFPKN